MQGSLTLCLAVLLTATLAGCSPAPVSVQINSSAGAGTTPAASGAPASGPGTPSSGAGMPPTTSFSCSFPDAPTNCGFVLQAAASDRAMIVGPGRDGPTAVELTTEPGDINLFGSGAAERADLALPPSAAYCNQGQEEWWAHSLMFPGGYVIPLPQLLVWNWGVVFDFHHTGSSGQPNFQIVSLPTGLELWVAGGPSVVNAPAGSYRVPIGTVQFDVWYDFVYHVRWSSGSDGYFQTWLDGKQVMNYGGPTLYTGQSCYLKLANYHTPLGLPVSVIHSRVIRGATEAEVQLP
jgi:Polysaccharide lyase